MFKKFLMSILLCTALLFTPNTSFAMLIPSGGFNGLLDDVYVLTDRLLADYEEEEDLPSESMPSDDEEISKISEKEVPENTKKEDATK